VPSTAPTTAPASPASWTPTSTPRSPEAVD
jgi:hypothetical protein